MSTLTLTRGTTYSQTQYGNTVRGTTYAQAAATEPVPLVCGYDPARCSIFQSVYIDYMVAGNTRVGWQMSKDAAGRAPEPWGFSLQVSQTGLTENDTWEDTDQSLGGLTPFSPNTNIDPIVKNTFTLVDPVSRALGKQLTVHYRIKLTDSLGGIWYSPPASVLGNLSFREWIWAREMTRQNNLRMRKSPSAVQGYLLKRKRQGVLCTACYDKASGMVTNSHCPVCHGTRYVDGYYKAVPCFYADLSPVEIEEQLTDGPEGWSAPAVIQGIMNGSPQLVTGDIWVNAFSDLRYYVGKVSVLNHIRGLPIIVRAVLWQFPFSHEAYQLPLGDE